MKNGLIVIFVFVCFISCTSENENWPQELKEMEIGLKVSHSTDTIYATLNTKDPETWGKYQLQFTTTVETLNQNLEIVEFGGYLWDGDHWEMRTIYNRPFNKAEFEKWYNCPNGMLEKGESYSDTDNWMGKMNYLTGEIIIGLWYFIGKNKEGKRYVGAKEIVAISAFKN